MTTYLRNYSTPVNATSEVAEAPIEVDDIYYEPLKISPTHGVVVCNLQFRTFEPSIMDFYVDFARRAAAALNMPCSGPVYLPTRTERWCVPKSPFIHKKRQEVFERKTHKRLIQIKDSHPQVVRKWLSYLQENAPAGIGMKASVWDFHEVGHGQKLKVNIRDSDLPDGERVKLLAEKLVAGMMKEQPKKAARPSKK
ncbi:ribosomal protein S10 [Basidiobolus meristosporus CBS 931.73]|uniref:Small ribosomal subunit protein uS10m n=1 Tax=Basidiobolus meristosporus CBS 931.73 TaxID=1314790 RepID=A0A1Y1ZDZ4_9FUNG|nr:ribosomal protein S10 [Basidiobolus meristosporus CBS 931.73]|eukprot:ORY08015.1 ribosomal protein S10 [Basidiobolus meristosporus CBS 931.73]